jgi:hypothetical protein
MNLQLPRVDKARSKQLEEARQILLKSRD